MLSWIITLFIVAIGGVLTLKRSTWLVDYSLIVFVFNRGLRRLLDWEAGEFNRLSPISLTPLLIGCLMFIPFLMNYRQLPQTIRTILGCLAVALGYGFVIGFLRIQFGAVYALAEALAPVGAFGFILTAGASPDVRDRWIRTAAWCAIFASIYGWYQYLTIPPWDAFWVTAVGFVGYLGQLRPTEMTVFSTMAERGPLASYLAFAVAPMIISPKWRTSLSWLGVLIVFSVILLTLARSGVIIAVLSVLVYLVINRGAGGLHIIFGAVVLMVGLSFGLGKVPGAERITTRFETLGNMKEDGSYKGRAELRQIGLRQIISNPIGYGLGATGIAGRINTDSLEGQANSVDAGYFDILSTFGLIGSGFYFYAFWAIWKELSRRYKEGYRTGHVMMARTFLIVLIPATMVGNFLNGFSLLWIVFGAALCPLGYAKFRRRQASLAQRQPPKITPALPIHHPSV